MEPNHKICITKKITYVSLFLILAILFIFLGKLTLESNQATNSRASTTQKKPQLKTLQASEPYCSIDEYNCYNLKLVRDNLKNVQFFVHNSSSIVFEKDKYYSVYLDNPLTHIMTFKGDSSDAQELFSKWRSGLPDVNKNNINQNKYILFTVPLDSNLQPL